MTQTRTQIEVVKMNNGLYIDSFKGSREAAEKLVKRIHKAYGSRVLHCSIQDPEPEDIFPGYLVSAAVKGVKVIDMSNIKA